jgi:plasmid stabilization system protein ParE
MRVQLSLSAAEFLRRESTYLRSKNPSAAVKFTALMREARLNLQRFPDIGNEQHKLPVPGAKTLVTGDYLLDYTRDGDCIVIVTIRHARMNDGLTPDSELDGDLDNDP